MPPYADLIQKFDQNTLTDAERSQLTLLGVIGEQQFRSQGSSMIPASWNCDNVPISEIREDILVAIGITVVGLSDLNLAAA